MHLCIFYSLVAKKPLFTYLYLRVISIYKRKNFKRTLIVVCFYFADFRQLKEPSYLITNLQIATILALHWRFNVSVRNTRTLAKRYIIYRLSLSIVLIDVDNRAKSNNNLIVRPSKYLQQPLSVTRTSKTSNSCYRQNSTDYFSSRFLFLVLSADKQLNQFRSAYQS